MEISGGSRHGNTVLYYVHMYGARAMRCGAAQTRSENTVQEQEKERRVVNFCAVHIPGFHCINHMLYQIFTNQQKAQTHPLSPLDKRSLLWILDTERHA